MSRLSAERKETLLRRYGSQGINAGAGPGGRRPGGFGGLSLARGMRPKHLATIAKILFAACVLGGNPSSLGGSYFAAGH